MDMKVVIAKKDAQIEELKKQNASYEQAFNDLKQSSENTIRKLQESLMILQDQVAQFQRMIFGRKSERFVADLLNYPNLFSHLEEEQIAKEQVQKEQKKIIPAHERKVSNHKGRQLLANCRHLDVEEIEIETVHSDESIHIGDLIRENWLTSLESFLSKDMLLLNTKKKILAT
jgi:hypothetical protein